MIANMKMLQSTWEVESVTALAERMSTSTASLTVFGVQRILTLVVLLTHLWRKEGMILR